MKKGIITLTEGRSGASWLGNLCNRTEVLGVSSEWVDPTLLGVSHKSLTGEGYIEEIVKAGSTGNGFFALKLFPRHVHWFQLQFGFDLISYLRAKYDIRILTVERKDRIGQAVSFVKAMQSGAWSSQQSADLAPVYDFDQICRCYFLIGRSYNFWASYLALRNLDHDAFEYEDMVGDPTRFLQAVARHAGVTDLPPVQSERSIRRDSSIQRDKSTEDWKARFLAEAETADIIDASTPSRPSKRSMVNFGRFLRGKQMKPGAFAY